MSKQTWILFIGTIFSYFTYAQYTESFIVEVNDQGMTITSPSTKLDTVSIIVKNNTLDKIISELRVKNKVLKRFVLTPNGKEVLSVKIDNTESLYYVPIAPPFEAAHLRFKQKIYEIPKKE